MYTRRQVRRPKVSDDKKSKRRKERERERGKKKNNLGINVFQCPFEKLRVCVCVCVGFVFLNGYQKRCPLFRSSVSHGLGEAQKSSEFVKREFGRKHLSVLCNSPRSFSSCPLPWTPERQHLGGGDLARGPQHREPVRSDSSSAAESHLAATLRYERFDWCWQSRTSPKRTHTHKQTQTQTQTRKMITHHCHLFTCYAGRSSLCVPWASRWQRAVGRRCPESRKTINC